MTQEEIERKAASLPAEERPVASSKLSGLGDFLGIYGGDVGDVSVGCHASAAPVQEGGGRLYGALLRVRRRLGGCRQKGGIA